MLRSLHHPRSSFALCDFLPVLDLRDSAVSEGSVDKQIAAVKCLESEVCNVSNISHWRRLSSDCYSHVLSGTRTHDRLTACRRVLRGKLSCLICICILTLISLSLTKLDKVCSCVSLLPASSPETSSYFLSSSLVPPSVIYASPCGASAGSWGRGWIEPLETKLDQEMRFPVAAQIKEPSTSSQAGKDIITLTTREVPSSV